MLLWGIVGNVQIKMVKEKWDGKHGSTAFCDSMKSHNLLYILLDLRWSHKQWLYSKKARSVVVFSVFTEVLT